jgi:DNA repair photolyase
MPVLPFLEDDPDNIRQIVRRAAGSGAGYILPAFGVTLRPGSREYFYQKLETHFPGLKERYIQAFGGSYECSAPNWPELSEIFQEETAAAGLSDRIPVFEPRKRSSSQAQMKLFSS